MTYQQQLSSRRCFEHDSALGEQCVEVRVAGRIVLPLSLQKKLVNVRVERIHSDKQIHHWSFLLVMGFQERDQSYSVWPEPALVMDHGILVEISNFLVRLSHCSHGSCFISSLFSAWWIHFTCAAHVCRMFDTRDPLSNCGQDRLLKMTGSTR